MSSEWPELPYDAWSATCDTLHAHTQVLGKLAVVLAPPEPQLQHAALRLTARGWETAPLPAPDGSGAFGVALDLRAHEALVEHVDGRVQAIALTPNRSVAAVTKDVLAAVGDLVGQVQINPKPQETPWQTPLDEDSEHATMPGRRWSATSWGQREPHSSCPSSVRPTAAARLPSTPGGDHSTLRSTCSRASRPNRPRRTS